MKKNENVTQKPLNAARQEKHECLKSYGIEECTFYNASVHQDMPKRQSLRLKFDTFYNCCLKEAALLLFKPL